MLSDNLCESVWSLKLKAGSKMIPVTVTKKGERLYLKFPYSPKMIEEVKAFDGHKWHGYEDPPEKTWSIKDSLRNRFQLDSLAHPGVNDPENPYRRYNEPLLEFLARRKIYVHQNDLAAHGFTRRQCIIASEMGTGKTLAAIEIMEASQLHDWIWVGPKSALVSVRLEFIKWQAKILPTFVTYEGLQKLLADWPEGKKAPHGVIFDECSRLKNPTAKRTQAARHLADSIRAEWGAKGFVILMSGTPSPKSPADWWSLCEIACPGFLREGTHEKFKQRLAITEMREQFAGGGSYSHLLSWKDDSRKCAKCGLLEKDETHDSGINVFGETSTQHKFEPTVNEVALLFQRMKGLVVVKFKKDCLDLPDKVYREIVCTPNRSMLNAARAIEAKSTSTIQALTLLRELSDGFQYFDRKDGTKICPSCGGRKTVNVPKEEILEEITAYAEIEYVTKTCSNCSGSGIVDNIVRDTRSVPSPKDDALRDLMDEYDEIGRMVVYGGFTGTIDRISELASGKQWKVIRVDGRGWHTDIPGLLKPEDMMNVFQHSHSKYPRIIFDGHPGSAGMGLTLTASPVIVYFSNDFNAESRIQSEDRIHRAGMDTNRGATIIDLLHLPTDKLVLDNLKTKRRLQDMTLGELHVQAEQVLTASQVFARL